jgi:serine phosphatase RsbU (regulator of sigma subunit)
LGLFNFPFYSAYSLEFASIFQIIILSYALTAKINIIKRENQEAISRTVIYQEQANAELEQKVKDRTIELNKYLLSIEKDLKMARNIQMNILPKNLDKIVNFDVTTFYQPLDEVGGDFFDVYQMSNNKLRILIADATGHGIQASMVTMTIKSEYDSLKVFLSDPGELIDELQKRFVEIYKNMKIYFSAFIIDIDLDEEMISYASAGHPNQYLIQDGKIIELIRSGHIIGMLSNKQCTTKKLPYTKKDKILLFTDGLYEEFNILNEQFGEEKLINLIEENINLGMNELVDKSLEALNIHLNNNSKQDDITIIGIEEKII